MTRLFNHNEAIRSLSIFLCALFLVVTAAKDFRSKTKSNSPYLEHLSSQHVIVPSVAKGLQLFPVNEPNVFIAPTTFLVGANNTWKSIPKTLLVSLAERNSFYVTASINAP